MNGRRKDERFRLMRGETDRDKISRFMAALSERARGPGHVYLVGGGTAVLIGWRETTIDLDIKADPAPAGLFEAIAQLKEIIDINVELASPADFIPELPGWRARSLFIARHGQIDFFHYDPASQALAKIERGHARDVADVAAMLDRALMSREQLWALFLKIEPRLIRYPAVDAAAFRMAVIAVCRPAGESAQW